MVRTHKDVSNMTISVWLKSGEYFLNRDITDNPFGDHERVVSFWEGDTVRVFPMSEVKEYQLHFSEQT